MGPKVAGDEVIQAERGWEAAGWGLHAWVKAGGPRVYQLLLCVSSVGKGGGRESPAGSRLSVPSGPDLGVGPAGWELTDPGERPLRAPACRLPGPAPRGTMGRLLGRGQELRVGVGDGRPGREEGRLAGSAPAGQPLWGSQCTARPSPPSEGRGNWGSWQGRAWALGLCFSSLCHSQALCGHLLANGHKGLLRRGGEAPDHGEATRPLPNRAKVPGRWSALGISRPREPFPLSSEEYQLSSSASSLGLKPQRAPGAREGWGGEPSRGGAGRWTCSQAGGAECHAHARTRTDVRTRPAFSYTSRLFSEQRVFLGVPCLTGQLGSSAPGKG